MTMAERVHEYAIDLAAFADLGTAAPRVEEGQHGHSIILVRKGDEIELQFPLSDDSVVEQVGDREVKHSTFVSLLSSERFGNLRDWAVKQRAFLVSELSS